MPGERESVCMCVRESEGETQRERKIYVYLHDVKIVAFMFVDWFS